MKERKSDWARKVSLNQPDFFFFLQMGSITFFVIPVMLIGILEKALSSEQLRFYFILFSSEERFYFFIFYYFQKKKRFRKFFKGFLSKNL